MNPHTQNKKTFNKEKQSTRMLQPGRQAQQVADRGGGGVVSLTPFPFQEPCPPEVFVFVFFCLSFGTVTHTSLQEVPPMSTVQLHGPLKSTREYLCFSARSVHFPRLLHEVAVL